MAIALDAVGTAGTKTATPWSITGSHTAAGGADCLALIYVQFLCGSTVTPNETSSVVTYGGVNCEFLGFSYVGSAGNAGFQAVYGLWNPPTGAQTTSVAVTYVTGTPVLLRINSVSYTGVGSIGEVFQNFGTSTAPSITVASATGRLLVHVGSVASTTLTGYSQTARYTNVTTHSMVIGDAAGASSVTFSFTSSNQVWGNLVVELIASPDSGVVRMRSIVEASLTAGSSASLAGSATIQINASDATTKLLVGVVISVSTNSTSTTCSVTCGGVAMTQEYFLQYGATTERAAIGIYSLANPGTGSKTITATSGGTSTKTQVAIGGVCYTGAGTISAAASAAAIALSVSSQSSGRAFYAGANGAAISAPTQTERFMYGGAPAGCGDWILVQDAPGSTTVSFGGTGTATTPQSAGVSIAPASTGVTGTIGASAQRATAALSGVMQPAGTIVSQVGGVGGFEAEIDFSGKGTAAMPSVLDTGQAVVSTYSPNSGANPTIVGGRYVNQYVGAGSGASYLTIDQALVSGENTYLQATFKITGSGATDSWAFGLASARDRMANGALGAGPFFVPVHMAFDNTGWNAGYYDAGGNHVVLTHTYSPTVDHTVDHTVSVLVIKASNKLTVVGCDGVSVDVTDTNFGAVAGNYAWCEIYYGAASTDKRIEVSNFKATSRVAGANEPGKMAASLAGGQAQAGTVAAAAQKATAALAGAQAQAGTVAAAAQKATAALAGVMQPAGTIAAALQKAVASLLGGQEHTGTVAAALQRNTAALAGGQEYTGTVFSTLQPTAASLAGAQTQTGTVAAALQKATAALLGTQEYTGTVAATAQKVTAAVAGVMHSAGTVDATLRPMLAALLGAQEHTGTVDATAQKATAAVAGSLQPTGTVAAALQAAAALLAGVPVQTGTVASTLQVAVVSLAGFMQPVGTVVSALQKATAALAGGQEYTGVVFVTLQTSTTSLEGLMAAAGTVNAALLPLTAIMTSGSIAAGSMDAVLQRLTYVGVATQTQTGSVDASLQKAVATLLGVQSQTGIIASVLQKTLFSAAGSQGAAPLGTVAALLKPGSAGITGLQIQAGAVVSTLRPTIAALLGTEHPTGTVGALLQKVLFAASGAPQQHGSIAASLLAAWFSNLGDYQMAWGQGAGKYRVYDHVSMAPDVNLLFSFQLVPVTGPHLYLNGVEVPLSGDNGVVMTVPNLGADALLGGRNSQDHGMDGWIGEMILYDHAVTPAERAQVENYLRSKWNL